MSIKEKLPDDLLNNHDEIVAVNFNKKIIVDPESIIYIIKNENPNNIKPISRAMCRFMSRLDLGNKWAEIAKLPTVFHLDWDKYLHG